MLILEIWTPICAAARFMWAPRAAAWLEAPRRAKAAAPVSTPTTFRSRFQSPRRDPQGQSLRRRPARREHRGRRLLPRRPARREVHAGAGEALETVRRDPRFPSLARVGLIC